MTREQVIKGLLSCLWDEKGRICEYCPYALTEEEKTMGKWECHMGQLRQDAYDLLKEQEPKQAKKLTFHVKTTLGYEKPIVATRYDWLCPTCESLLCRDIDVIDDNYHFCKVCGQAVKWE